MNLWHDVPLGKNAPKEINTIIEISKGSHNKYEIDKETGLIKLDRANYNGAPYPFDYGFAPQTYWDDGDALDVVVLATYPLPTGILVTVRPVAVMEMIDTGEPDSKIIAVPIDDKRWEHVQDLKDVNPHTLKEIKHFFETYKALKNENSPVIVGEVSDRKAAHAAVDHSVKLYKEKFAK